MKQKRQNGMKRVSPNIDQMQASVIINNVGMNKCKKLIDKGVFDKGFIWNPSNCQCECDNSCDVAEYLGYENCKCRKKLVDKLNEECTENVEEVKLAKTTSAEHA